MDSKWPKYYSQRLWLGNPDGCVGVMTLWTPVDIFSSLVSKNLSKKISVIGQLHTKRGFEFVFRNIWVRPRIRYLIMCGQDGCGTGDYVIELMKLGKVQGSFFEEVDKKYIDEFRKGVELIDLRGKPADEVMKIIEKLEYKGVFSKKTKIFAQAKAKEARPSETLVFRLEAKTIGEAWLQVLKLISQFGRKVPRIHVYGGFERMLLNMAVVISGEDMAKPKIWHYFQFNKDDLKAYFKNFFTPKRGEEAYTYGERMFAYEVAGKKIDQVTLMVKKMRSFEYNKGAVVTLWQPEIDNFPVRKPWRTPCLSLVQGICLEGKFMLTAYFRSNDMYGAWPQNAFALRKLQTEIAKKINKKMGDLTIISSCAFVDEADMVEVQSIVDKNKKMFSEFDPRGNLIIEVEGKELVVKHTTPSGEVIKEYRQKIGSKTGVADLVEKLISDNVISRVDHGISIGIQLARAEMAVKFGLKFEQDKEMKGGAPVGR